MSRIRKVIAMIILVSVIFAIHVYFDYREHEALIIKDNIIQVLFICGFVVVAFWYTDFIDKREVKKKKNNEENAP